MFGKKIRVGKEEHGSLPERLAESLGTSAGAKMIYGEPVINDGVVIIPVAKVRFGFGGGNHNGEEGGGGGEIIQPAGYIELKDGFSRFQPIRDPIAFIPLVIAGGVTGFLLLRSLYNMLRRTQPSEE